MKTLRDVNNLAFVHRDRIRFRGGTSELLGIELEPQPGGGFIADVANVEELHRIDIAKNGTATVGTFVTRDELKAALPLAFPQEARLSNVRMRLGLYGARITVYGLGRTRIAPIDALTLAPHELPATIEIPPIPKGLAIAERRHTTSDGMTSFVIGVTVALRVSVLGRFENVRVFLDLDGEVRRAAEAEAKLERQPADPEAFTEAARAAASSIGGDPRANAIARAVPPLVIATLRDALDAARAA